MEHTSHIASRHISYFNIISPFISSHSPCGVPQPPATLFLLFTLLSCASLSLLTRPMLTVLALVLMTQVYGGLWVLVCGTGEIVTVVSEIELGKV